MDAGHTWKVYYDDYAQTFALRNLHGYGDRFERFEAFARDVASGELPEHSFIEPRGSSAPGWPSGLPSFLTARDAAAATFDHNFLPQPRQVTLTNLGAQVGAASAAPATADTGTRSISARSSRWPRSSRRARAAPPPASTRTPATF